MPEILVVDDDPAIRKVLAQAFELEDYQVRTAFDGVNALEEINKQLPDVVILDVMMPEMGGYEVLKRIRETPEAKHLPVIILTAKGSMEDQWEGWQQGIDYYMTKPFDVEELLRFLEYVFNQHGAGQTESP